MLEKFADHGRAIHQASDIITYRRKIAKPSESISNTTNQDNDKVIVITNAPTRYLVRPGTGVGKLE